MADFSMLVKFWLLFTACSELHKVLVLALSVTNRVLLNWFATNLHGRRLWSLPWTS